MMDNPSLSRESNLSSKRKLVKTNQATSCDKKRKLNDDALPPKDCMKTSPSDHLLNILQQNGVNVGEEVAKIKFEKPSQAMIDSYSHEKLSLMRGGDLPGLRRLQQDGQSLDCCNRFGESLLHMACRRGLTDVVRFMLKDAGVSFLVRDDFGRTPFHDACWTSEPNFDLATFLIAEAPQLLCVKDVRGHTPLNYVRREHWPLWISFLSEHEKALISGLLSSTND